MKPLLPFSKLSVLDISQGIAGPYCTEILWQQGAHVIKIEPPEGDWGRHVGAARNGHSSLSISYNAGKQSVCVDGRTAEGKQVLRRLAAQADVVVQNFRPGVAERLGMGYEDLIKTNPDLIYVSISGYGVDGPYAQAPASDSVMQADSGLMFANQDAAGSPRRFGMLMADIATALYAAQQTSAALFHRAMTKEGMHLKLSLFEACAALQVNDITAFGLEGERVPGAVSAPNGIFDTADGAISVLALNNDQFARLSRALNRPDWLKDERFESNEKRMVHRGVLHQQVGEQLREQNTQHWMAMFSEHDVLHAPVRDYTMLAAHPQAEHLGMFQPVEQPDVGLLNLPGLPGAGLHRPLQASPRVGEHTTAILSKAGFSAAEIAQLLQAGAIKQAAITTNEVTQ
ncbi:CoA transferase [Alcaligenaceae bacterium]|nr:CoA transferase [Alcaligenaceae bacterium]